MVEGFSTVLRLARVVRGLSQVELSRLTGLSTSLLTKLENGRILKPRPEVRLALAKALGQPVELFLAADELRGQQEKDALVAMLVRCRVSETAATILVNSVHARSRKRVMRALEKG